MSLIVTAPHQRPSVPAIAGAASSASSGPLLQAGGARRRRGVSHAVRTPITATSAPPAPVVLTPAPPAPTIRLSPTTGHPATPTAGDTRPPTPEVALGLDAGRLERLLGAARRPARWSLPSFGREVDLVRAHLRPITSAAFLAASVGLEAYQGPDARRRGDPLSSSPVRVAYVLRWLELTDGVARPGWRSLLAA